MAMLPLFMDDPFCLLLPHIAPPFSMALFMISFIWLTTCLWMMRSSSKTRIGILEDLRMAFGVEEVSGRPNILEVLCPELIVEVFSHLEDNDLASVAQVCKYFKDLVYSKRLWSDKPYTWSLKDIRIGDDVIRSMVQKGIKILYIDEDPEAAKKSSNANDICLSLLKFKQLYPQLEYIALELRDTQYLDGVTAAFKGMNFSVLTRLYLEFDPVKYVCKKSRMNNRMVEFLQLFPKLEDLWWDMSSSLIGLAGSHLQNVTNRELQNALEHMTNLKVLTVELNRWSIPFPGGQCQSDTLERLKLVGMQFDSGVLQDIRLAFPKLRSLQIVYCRYRGGDFVQACYRSLSNLRKLTISKCRNISTKDARDLEKLGQHINFVEYSE